MGNFDPASLKMTILKTQIRIKKNYYTKKWVPILSGRFARVPILSEHLFLAQNRRVPILSEHPVYVYIYIYSGKLTKAQFSKFSGAGVGNRNWR